jgi:hypothetical protein
LRQDSLCSQHIVGEKLSGFGEVASPPPAGGWSDRTTEGVGGVIGRSRRRMNGKEKAFMSLTFKALVTLVFAIITVDAVFGAEAKRPHNIT